MDAMMDTMTDARMDGHSDGYNDACNDGRACVCARVLCRGMTYVVRACWYSHANMATPQTDAERHGGKPER
eukprot:15445302-Alexandrium_andersonii.AAC.1